jgi:hypothetical protein
VRETRCKAPHVRIAFEAHTRRRFDQNGRGYGRSDAEPDFHEIEQHVVPPVDRAQRFTDAAGVSEARECIGERRRRLATIFEMTAQFAAQIISAPAARHPCGFDNRFDDGVDIVTHHCHPGLTASRPKSETTGGVSTAPGAGPWR